jgi:hypothetical protein
MLRRKKDCQRVSVIAPTPRLLASKLIKPYSLILAQE